MVNETAPQLPSRAMRYGRGAAVLAGGVVLFVSGQLWTLLDGPSKGANIGAGLVSVLGVAVAVAGLIVLALRRTGRRH